MPISTISAINAARQSKNNGIINHGQQFKMNGVIQPFKQRKYTLSNASKATNVNYTINALPKIKHVISSFANFS